MSSHEVKNKDEAYLEFDKNEFSKEIDLSQFLDLEQKETQMGQRPLPFELFKYFGDFGFYFLANGKDLHYWDSKSMNAILTESKQNFQSQKTSFEDPITRIKKLSDKKLLVFFQNSFSILNLSSFSLIPFIDLAIPGKNLKDLHFIKGTSLILMVYDKQINPEDKRTPSDFEFRIIQFCLEEKGFKILENYFQEQEHFTQYCYLPNTRFLIGLTHQLELKALSFGAALETENSFDSIHQLDETEFVIEERKFKILDLIEIKSKQNSSQKFFGIIFEYYEIEDNFTDLNLGVKAIKLQFFKSQIKFETESNVKAEFGDIFVNEENVEMGVMATEYFQHSNYLYTNLAPSPLIVQLDCEEDVCDVQLSSIPAVPCHPENYTQMGISAIIFSKDMIQEKDLHERFNKKFGDSENRTIVRQRNIILLSSNYFLLVRNIRNFNSEYEIANTTQTEIKNNTMNSIQKFFQSIKIKKIENHYSQKTFSERDDFSNIDSSDKFNLDNSIQLQFGSQAIKTPNRNHNYYQNQNNTNLKNQNYGTDHSNHQTPNQKTESQINKNTKVLIIEEDAHTKMISSLLNIMKHSSLYDQEDSDILEKNDIDFDYKKFYFNPEFKFLISEEETRDLVSSLQKLKDIKRNFEEYKKKVKEIGENKYSDHFGIFDAKKNLRQIETNFDFFETMLTKLKSDRLELEENQSFDYQNYNSKLFQKDAATEMIEQSQTRIIQLKRDLDFFINKKRRQIKLLKKLSAFERQTFDLPSNFDENQNKSTKSKKNIINFGDTKQDLKKKSFYNKFLLRKGMISKKMFSEKEGLLIKRKKSSKNSKTENKNTFSMSSNFLKPKPKRFVTAPKISTESLARIRKSSDIKIQKEHQIQAISNFVQNDQQKYAKPQISKSRTCQITDFLKNEFSKTSQRIEKINQVLEQREHQALKKNQQKRNLNKTQKVQRFGGLNIDDDLTVKDKSVISLDFRDLSDNSVTNENQNQNEQENDNLSVFGNLTVKDYFPAPQEDNPKQIIRQNKRFFKQMFSNNPTSFMKGDLKLDFRSKTRSNKIIAKKSKSNVKQGVIDRLNEYTKEMKCFERIFLPEMEEVDIYSEITPSVTDITGARGHGLHLGGNFNKPSQNGLFNSKTSHQVDRKASRSHNDTQNLTGNKSSNQFAQNKPISLKIPTKNPKSGLNSLNLNKPGKQLNNLFGKNDNQNVSKSSGLFKQMKINQNPSHQKIKTGFKSSNKKKPAESQKNSQSTPFSLFGQNKEDQSSLFNTNKKTDQPKSQNFLSNSKMPSNNLFQSKDAKSVTIGTTKPKEIFTGSLFGKNTDKIPKSKTSKGLDVANFLGKQQSHPSFGKVSGNTNLFPAMDKEKMEIIKGMIDSPTNKANEKGIRKTGTKAKKPKSKETGPKMPKIKIPANFPTPGFPKIKKKDDKSGPAMPKIKIPSNFPTPKITQSKPKKKEKAPEKPKNGFNFNLGQLNLGKLNPKTDTEKQKPILNFPGSNSTTQNSNSFPNLSTNTTKNSNIQNPLNKIQKTTQNPAQKNTFFNPQTAKTNMQFGQSSFQPQTNKINNTQPNQQFGQQSFGQPSFGNFQMKPQTVQQPNQSKPITFGSGPQSSFAQTQMSTMQNMKTFGTTGGMSGGQNNFLNFNSNGGQNPMQNFFGNNGGGSNSMGQSNNTQMGGLNIQSGSFNPLGMTYSNNNNNNSNFQMNQGLNNNNRMNTGFMNQGMMNNPNKFNFDTSQAQKYR